jgi:hypothetical protein
MLLFLVKKTFFDMWDNLFPVFILNICMIILVALLLLVPTFVEFTGITFFLYIVGSLVILNFYIGAVYKYTLGISDYETGSIKDFILSIIHSWKENLASSLLMIGSGAIILVGLPYYFLSQSYLFIVFGVILMWVCITIFAAGLYFFPVSFRLKKNILQSIRISIAFVLENVVFTGFVLLVFILLIPLSLLLLLMFPGPVGMILWINECFKIRLYKYDYLKENPGADKKKIPWKDLIRSDVEKVGERTLRGMIFPWK